MMNILATTKMSSRGQVVIPEDIRKQLHLETGTQFAVIAENNVVILKIITPPKLSEFKGILNKIQKAAKAAGLTPKDLEEVIKEDRKK
ncbi:MAG: AbrB/MazE/SpoVT family DNA-binding domain-containing protein [Legionellales bacterium]|jgi:AbrB family looped-hinge helix DNA binding protein